jgi:hypothetical protein
MEARYESERVCLLYFGLFHASLSTYYLDIILRYSATHNARAMSPDQPSQHIRSCVQLSCTCSSRRTPRQEAFELCNLSHEKFRAGKNPLSLPSWDSELGIVCSCTCGSRHTPLHGVVLLQRGQNFLIGGSLDEQIVRRHLCFGDTEPRSPEAAQRWEKAIREMPRLGSK